LNNAYYNREESNTRKADGASGSKYISQFDGISRSALIEVVPAQFSDVGSSARISSRRIASADQLSAVGNQALNFVRIDSSVMVSTRRESSPSGITFTLRMESKRVARFNLEDILPTNFDAIQGIVNDDALITDLKTWAMDNQVNECGNESGNSHASSGINEITSNNGLNNSETKKTITTVRSKNRSFRSEEFNVRHSIIRHSDASLICEGLHV
jgi:hypothetical protein